MTSPIVRFAPSPTGRLHIGNARPALLNYLYALAHNGRFVLRFDDTDLARSSEEFAQAIEVDLSWLGVAPHLTLRQSRRVALYDAAAGALRDSGQLYPCYETPDELEKRRKLQQARGLPPVYDRAALRLTADERARLEAEGRRPHWRFRLEPGVVAWRDLVRGDCAIDCASLSDPVLLREDGSYLYTLPSVVDDIDVGITHVIRGEDHVTNTAVQIRLFEALAPAHRPPVFAHHNLLVGSSGEALSKRSGALSIGSLREEGYEALAVAAVAVLTGSSDSVHPIRSLAELAKEFDLAHLSRNAARFDPADLGSLTHRTLARLDYDDVRERLEAHEIVGFKAEPFWLAVRGNLTRFADVLEWWRVVEGEIAPVREDADLLAAALASLPQEPFDETTWGAWTAALKATTGRKGKALFHPLRLALTGAENGPELSLLLPLIGHARAAARLAGG
ncbi:MULTISPECIES: glutamate--tRNA ligase [Methylosinus]|uniref:Glutamate--tRNA ligase n=1 Tax=Methylosinus trichosporium (strain ATCC 35070 / NCIMB 11131 / UNIQEM 75 / OB3b) TaxID=595536 RepID=A0A2D2D5I7_METT3|nr:MULTISPECIES: glutamate--tRNA ligase [Methylosinus]ATQ70301.1 glutamate--tRNA ligase [Methylosinus trichosporium OB3b]OBS53806.1 glutamate--tRNA ligase [Methylosinus sp. 3S-1]